MRRQVIQLSNDRLSVSYRKSIAGNILAEIFFSFYFLSIYFQCQMDHIHSEHWASASVHS